MSIARSKAVDVATRTVGHWLWLLDFILIRRAQCDVKIAQMIYKQLAEKGQQGCGRA